MSIQLKLLVILFLLSIHCFSQDYKGSIVDAKTQKGIPYANIGIPNKGYGVICNENGEFILKITTEKDTDVIQVSNIGYQTKYIALAQFKKIGESNCKLELTETVYELATTTVRPNEYETKIVGAKDASELKCDGQLSVKGSANDTATARINKEKGIKNEGIGLEMGNKIKIDKGQQTFIDKIRFKTCLKPNDTCVYRINIYTEGETKKRMITPFGVVKLVSTTNVMKEPVVLKVIGKTDVQEIDLSAQNIEVFDDFMIAIECLYTSNDDINLAMDVSVFGSTDLFFRESTMAEWIKIPLIDVTFVSASVTQKKQKNFWNKLFN